MSDVRTNDLQQAVQSLSAMRRIVVDHICTGLRHPDDAVVRQARALATEMDAAGLNVDLAVDDQLAVT